MAMINHIARQIAESHRIYDSVLRSLTASTAMEAARKALAERAALEKSSIASLSSSLKAYANLGTVGHFAPLLRKFSNPNIVNISSGITRLTTWNMFLYGTAKTDGGYVCCIERMKPP